MNSNVSWKVLLIGGGSGVGKTYLTKKLSEHYKCAYLKVDNLRYFMQNVLRAQSEDFPELFSNTLSNNDNITSNHFMISEFLKPGLKALIEKYEHYGESPAMIIEGIELLPKTLDLKPSNSVRGLFLYDNLENLANRMQNRGRGKLTSQEYKTKASNSMDFIELVVKEAKYTGFSTLSVDPENTVLQRAIQLIENS